MCILKCKYTVLEFFSFFLVFVLPEVFDLLQALWIGSFFHFIDCFFFFSFLLWILACSPFCGLGPRLTYTF